jgi:hypothetical protein
MVPLASNFKTPELLALPTGYKLTSPTEHELFAQADEKIDEEKIQTFPSTRFQYQEFELNPRKRKPIAFTFLDPGPEQNPSKRINQPLGQSSPSAETFLVPEQPYQQEADRGDLGLISLINAWFNLDLVMKVNTLIMEWNLLVEKNAVFHANGKELTDSETVIKQTLSTLKDKAMAVVTLDSGNDIWAKGAYELYQSLEKIDQGMLIQIRSLPKRTTPYTTEKL